MIDLVKILNPSKNPSFWTRYQCKSANVETKINNYSE